MKTVPPPTELEPDKAHQITRLSDQRYHSDGLTAWPIWLGDDVRPAFGWFHKPAGNKCRGGAVICPPLGQEYIDTHYGLRLLAERLAQEGLCSVRFDYDGTGDSAGDAGDPDRVSSWLGTVKQAVEVLRVAGVANVCLVGMRLGAALAASAASSTGDVDQLVLWDPCSGRQFLRQQKGLRTMKFGPAGAAAEGSAELLGLRFGPETVKAVNDLSATNGQVPLARRALVLVRGDRPSDPSLQIAPLGLELTERDEAVGQQAFMDQYPQELPRAAIDRIAQWLSAGCAQESTAMVAPPVAGPRRVGWASSGQAVMEVPVSIPPLGLFGIVTFADGAPAPGIGGAPPAVFANVAKQHHIGPTRLWVELARQWAGAGVVSLRFDLSGLGDSPGRPGDDKWTCHKPAAFDDFLDTVRFASPGDPSNVVLIGLCSGGYQALETALDLKARGLMVINAAVSFNPAERRAGLPLDPRRRVVLPKDEVAGTFRAGGRLESLRERFPNLAWRVRIMTSPRRRSGVWLRQLVQNGTDAFLICGDAEMRPIRNGTTTAQLARLRRTRRLRLEHLAGLQHDLFITEHRQLVSRLVTEHCLERFAPIRPREGATGT